MKNNKQCKIIQDLLPVYRDKLTSQNVSEFVEEHLNICEDCREEYKKLNKLEKVKQNGSNINTIIKKRVIALFSALLCMGFILVGISVYCTYANGLTNTFNIIDWIPLVTYSISIYLFPCLLLFVSIIFLKTKSDQNDNYWAKVITTFLIIGIVTLFVFRLLEFFKIII